MKNEKINEINTLYQVAESMICMKKFNYGLELYKKLLESEEYKEILNDENNEIIWKAGAWHGYANCLEKAGDIEKSKIAYEKALELHLKDVNKNGRKAYLWGGWAAFKLNRIEMAYDLFKKATEEDPSYAYSWLSFSMVCVKLNKMDEAKKARENYKKYYEMKPYRRRECEGRDMLLNAYKNAQGWLKEYIEKILPETECTE